jgi:ubiquinone biosynthesis protein
MERDARRVREILGVAVRYGLSDWIETIPVPGGRALLHAVADKEIGKLSKEERVRLALTELGTTYIKVGQMLATRPDIVGTKLAEELSRLHADTPPEPVESVYETIHTELGAFPHELFASFDAEPFASASIAQVHRARLFSGEEVAVKVQKAGIRAKIEADLSVLESVAELVEGHSETYKAWEPVRLVHEFRRSITRELDFVEELRNMETFAQNFCDDPNVHFARTWSELSGRTVLTMELLQGIPGTDLEALQESGEDLNDFAMRGARAYLDMVFRDSFYHADPHPGNLMMLEGGVVGIIDCGMVGRVDDGLREDLESLVAAVTEGDADWLTAIMWPHTNGQPETARNRMQSDFSELLADSKRPIGTVDVGGMLTGVLEVFRRYRVSPRPGLTQLMRMLIVLNGTGLRFSPQFSLQAILEPYKDEAMKRRLDPRTVWKRFQRSFLEWDKFLHALPAEVMSTMQRFRTGEFLVGLEHRHLDSVVNRLVLGILTASLILGSSLLWSTKAPPLVGGVSAMGAIGFLAALVLGTVLFRAVRRSGRTIPRDQSNDP